MYVPRINKVEDRKIIADYIRKNNFGALVTSENGVPHATHLPMELFVDENENWVLKGHMAKANGQWQTFESHRALCIFSDAHTYVSSSWYSHLNVPTWNYIAIHLYGTVKTMNDSALERFIAYQLERYEAASEHPVKMEHFSPESIKRQLRGVVGFEFSVQDIQARFKLSQNRSETDFQNVIRELEKRKDAHSHEIARQMRNLKENTSSNP